MNEISSPPPPAAPAPSSIQTYFRLLRYLKPLAIPFIVSILGFVLFAASMPMLAKLMELVIEAINLKDPHAQWLLPLATVGVFFIRGIGSFLGNYYNAFVGARLVTNLRIEMFDHLTTLPVNYFNEEGNGQIYQRLTGSIGLISAAVTDALKVMIREGFTIVFLLAYIFYLNWKMSLVFLILAPILFLIVRYTTVRFRDITRKSQGMSGNIMQSISELLAGHQVMRIFNGADYEKARHAKAGEGAFKIAMKMRKLSSLATPAVQLLVAFALAAIIFMLLRPATMEHYSAGELIGYLTAVTLIPKSMRQLSGLNVIIQQGITGAEIIFELLDAKSETDNGTHSCARVQGRISVKDVSFQYNSSAEPVLSNISFDIVPGEMVALVGKSGSGKSTLATLLQRFYDVNQGSISIDGVDIRDYKLASLRQQIALVSQNLILFNDTVRNNIAYGGMRGATEDAILEAAKRAHALEFIEKLPQGLDTLIGDNGLQLSGGQRQRIAIARAFLKNAPILILDEATSALDNQSEQHIQQALDEIMKGRTTIVIAHRLSTIEKADTILVMDSGKIIETGTHQQLINQSGHYAKLYQVGF